MAKKKIERQLRSGRYEKACGEKKCAVEMSPLFKTLPSGLNPSSSMALRRDHVTELIFGRWVRTWALRMPSFLAYIRSSQLMVLGRPLEGIRTETWGFLISNGGGAQTLMASVWIFGAF